MARPRFPIPATGVITTIPDNAFVGHQIARFAVPPSIEFFVVQCFRDMHTLTKLTFTGISKLKVIGSGAFYACSSLRFVDLPASVEHLGEQCFGCCSHFAS
jgi:hypothetical protein